MKSAIVAAVLLMGAGAQADIPELNASCPGNIDVRTEEGGPIYINGKEADLKKVSDHHYEAQSAGVIVSVTINADGSPSISYKGLGAANAVCVISGGTRA
ncbi:hypothetical protein G3545_14670 [Starkeya sp. ORNL1]|uniref:hypothetical protein n=1 Tax=Starkeya sp. ORNL1 TaxID=2709380 RepID=UPI001464841B|nr:hypothetical protein [Starkeya sp. ORNL1]QJP14779.1 hypothetical protein G3545_14670 [Starkeya sp. ORNL1]